MSWTAFRRNCWISFVIVLLSGGSTACLVRTRTVAPPKGQPANRKALTASRDELIARLHRLADPIQSFTLKADMSPSVGGVFGGKVTDYPTIQGIILVKRPDLIRVIGLDPVVHSTILDMVSARNDFHLWLPTRNEFIEGINDAPANSPNKLENLRPVAFLNALLINPPKEEESAVLEDVSDETHAEYKLLFIEQRGAQLRLWRSVYFDRYTLDVSRQRTFDEKGQVTSLTRYSSWTQHGTVRFPGIIDMTRPQDGYELQLAITDFKLNPPELTDDKLTLSPPPPNAQVRVLSK